MVGAEVRAGGVACATAWRLNADRGGTALLRAAWPPIVAPFAGVTSALRITSPLPSSDFGTATPALAMFCPLANADLGAAVTAPGTMRFA